MTGSTSPSGTPLVTPIDWNDLINVARHLLTPILPAAQPTPASVRRAVSTAYYAMFHALLSSNADALVGLPHDQTTLDAWLRVYRNTNHGPARSALKNNLSRFTPDVHRFASLFCDLQDERHNADYNPQASVMTAQTALNWTNRTEVAIRDFLNAGHGERALVATLTTIPGSR